MSAPAPIRRPLEWAGAAPYHTLRSSLRFVVGCYFRNIEVRHPERIPRRGAVLVIANHPATLSEVFLLGGRLGRRFHFLAGAFLFRPWVRGAFLRLAGVLPIYRRQDDASLTPRNEETFVACHRLFDRGGAVVIFPEGESLTDRSLLPLRTGAARLALGYDPRPGGATALTVVPVGVHFSDRTAFQSDVIVSVGEPLDLAPFLAAADPRQAVRDLTGVMQRSLEALILNVPNPAVAGFVADVQRLYLQDLRETRAGEPDFELTRRIADCLHHYQRTDPERLYDGWRRTAVYFRKLEAMRLEDPAVKDGVVRRQAARSIARIVAGGAAGLAPVALGVAVNGLPFALTGWVVGRLAPAGIYVSAGRMIAGGILFPSTYVAIGAGLRLGAHWAWTPIAVLLAIAVPFGFFALAYVRWMQAEIQSLRLALLASERRRLVAKLRAERRSLIRLFDQARIEYLSATGQDAGAPIA